MLRCHFARVLLSSVHLGACVVYPQSVKFWEKKGSAPTQPDDGKGTCRPDPTKPHITLPLPFPENELFIFTRCVYMCVCVCVCVCMFVVQHVHGCVRA